MRAKLVNEGIKHLASRSQKEIASGAAGENIYKRFYIGISNNVEELVEEAFNENEKEIIKNPKIDPETDPIHLLGSFFLTNEELSFNHSGSWYFDSNGKMFCKEFDGEVDSYCQEFIEFLEKHHIEYKQTSKAGYFNVYVQFTGNARDIIQLVDKFFLSGFYENTKYTLEHIMEIIFT